jgi:integrase
MASIRTRVMADGGKRFYVRYRVHGRPIEEACKTATAAENLKRRVEGNELAGTITDPRAGDVTFKEYAELWLEVRLVRGRPLSPMTKRGYDGLLRRHLLPTFGKAKLRRISAEQVRKWFADTSKASSTDQAAKAYRLLRAIMATAVEDDRVGRNPCRIRGAGTERAVERPMVATSVVLDLADAIDPKLQAFVLLAGFGGLRTGELLGLQRQDIDPLHGVVHVRRQVHEVTGNARKASTRVVTAPKSEAGLRTVAIPGMVMNVLVDHLAAYTDSDPEAPVFPSKRGDQPLRRADLSLAWRAALVKVDDAPADLHVHDLRHHAATTMARMPGVTTKELMARIGHSSPRAALIYQHATAERDRAVADYLDAQIAAVERPARTRISLLAPS